MPQQNVIWTVLPNGVRSGRLHLSVFVSPRLTGDTAKGTLAPFTDWHNWPAKPITFYVKVGDAPRVLATTVGPAPRSDLWTKLFKPTTPVFTAGMQAAAATGRVIRSAPTSKVREFARTEYAAIGAWAATDPPTAFSLQPPCGGGLATQGGPSRPEFRLPGLRMSPTQRAAAVDAIREVLAEKGWVSGDEERLLAFSKDAITFLLTEQFQLRDPADNPGGSSDSNGAKAALKLQADDAPPELDFHTAVGALGEYPAMLRMFGLVRDLSIPLPAASPSVLVSVEPEWQSMAGTTNSTPVTECAVTATTFFAVASANALVKDGLLELEKPQFEVIDVDADAGARKLIDAAETIYQARSDDTNDGGFFSDPTGPWSRPQPPPSVESRGLSLIQSNRAEGLLGLLDKAAALESGLQGKTLADTTVNAEDIMRGFRLDVWDDVSKSWRSLCLRKGTYSFNGSTVTVDDEGGIIPAHTEQIGDPTIYLHESLARWIGYSLVASRPGKGAADDGGFVDEDTTPDPNFDLRTSFKAQPGTLPKLRYGRTYRLRARVTDLAGNGLRLGDVPANSPHVSATVKFRRYEPVEPPFVLLRKPRTEGESQEHLVIRSNYNSAATADSQRHLAPAQTSQHNAEQHGMFDVPANLLNPSGMSKLAYALIGDRNEGSLANSGKPDPGNQGLPYYEEEQLRVPYFPEVLARGAAFQGLPGTAADSVVTVDFDFALLQKWPDARPFRLQIVEGTGAPKFDSLRRVLTVQVPKGRSFDVKFSSKITAADRELLGTWGWLLEYIAAGKSLPADVTLAKLQQWAVEGRLWQLTPFRTLTLVHATRQPLLAPTFSKPIAVRVAGETSAKIVDKITLDHQSTNRFDLVARWTEPVDELTQSGPKNVNGETLVYQQEVDFTARGADLIAINRPHEFHDTKYRKVNYELVATTRFAEYFVERKNVKLVKGSAVAVSAAGFVPTSDVVASTAVEPKVTYVRGVDYDVNVANGTITALVDALHNQTVEVAFVAPPITRSSLEAKPPVAVDVPSSARPVAPDVAYIVPTFGWEKSSDATKVTSSRLGNGLRVYLRRPWYSSGAGEQLGVVLMSQLAAPDARMERHVTTWGQDPAFASSATTLVPVVADFAAAVRPKSNLKLAEADKDPNLITVSVAPHDVGYDADRGLWYSDLVVKQGAAYMPFVRLALARYQPISITKVELSPVVLAQFAQLSPNRTATVVFNGTDPTKLTLTVSGLTYPTTSSYATRSEIDVLVQEKNPALQGDLAWSTVATSTLPGAATGTWTGGITLPAARGSKPFRLVVREYELPSKGGRRLVYTDAIQI